jgi:hypothetical protein
MRHRKSTPPFHFLFIFMFIEGNDMENIAVFPLIQLFSRFIFHFASSSTVTQIIVVVYSVDSIHTTISLVRLSSWLLISVTKIALLLIGLNNFTSIAILLNPNCIEDCNPYPFLNPTLVGSL